MVIELYNYAQVPPLVVIAAEKETDKLVGDAGIPLLWLECPITTANAMTVANCQHVSLTNLMVRIVPDVAVRSTMKGQMLGFAVPAPEGGIYAAVFYNRVQVVAALHLASEAQILGYAMAHEIGHLLLGSEQHSTGGIMRARWTELDMKLEADGKLWFTSKQMRIMHAEVVRRIASTSTHR